MRLARFAFAAALGALITLPVLVGAAGAVCPEELSVFYGDKAYEHFGSSIAAVSDLDGDAATDLLVGGSNRYDAPGLARVFSGATGEVIYRFVDAYPSNGFGSPVNNAGDVDADGITDLIVAARQVQNIYNPGTGFVRVFSGADGALLYTWGGIQIGEAFGTAVASAGDMDQDGFADVAVGAPYYSRSEESLVGYVRVFSGRTGEIIHHIEGGFAFDNLGAAVDGVDDIDGDGVSDLLVGVPGSDQAAEDAGAAIVFSGRTGQPVRLFLGAFAGAALGTTVSGIGDVDGDGVGDVVVGAPAQWTQESYVQMFSGASGNAIRTIVAPVVSGEFGATLDDAGDVDGDNRHDVVVGARNEIVGGTARGVARVYSGRTGAKLAEFVSTEMNAGFARAVAGAGDANGDGFADVAVGAKYDSTYGTSAGAVFTYAVATPQCSGGGCAPTLVGSIGGDSPASARSIAYLALLALPAVAIALRRRRLRRGADGRSILP